MNDLRDTKLICFDLDGTLVRENSWYRLNGAFGVTPQEDQELYDAYYAGTLTYADWIRRLEELYRARGCARRSVAERVFKETRLCEGAADVLTYLIARGYTVVLITGSFDVLAEEIASRFRLTRWGAVTRLEFNADGSFKRIVSAGEEKFAKVEILAGIIEELGLPYTSCLCIGDDMNDVELFKVTGGGITFRDAPITEHVRLRIDTLADLKRYL